MLEKKHKLFMRKGAKLIRWIFFRNYYAYFVVRAKVWVFSKVSPPGKIVDCVVGNYIPGECSAPFDDACPNKKNCALCFMLESEGGRKGRPTSGPLLP